MSQSETIELIGFDEKVLEEDKRRPKRSRKRPESVKEGKVLSVFLFLKHIGMCTVFLCVQTDVQCLSIGQCQTAVLLVGHHVAYRLMPYWVIECFSWSVVFRA